MPGPPPPPPMAPAAPPPPPAFHASKGGSGGPDDRGALLNSIRKGTKLKKTVTVDKSGPYIPGKPSNNIGNNVNSSSGGNVSSSTNYSGNSVPNGLGGLFSAGMPKLRPTKKIGGSPLSSSTNNINNNDSNFNNNRGISSKPATPTKNFTSIQNELKKQLANPSDTRNRGPPPPAPSRNPPTMEDGSRQPFNTSNGHNRVMGAPVHHHSNSTSDIVIPNMSTLHRKAKSNVNLHTVEGDGSFKPVISHGKPNLAPKPPVANGKPAPPRKLQLAPSKPALSRAQSMKSPRSPSPQSPADVVGAKFGTVRHVANLLGQSGVSPRPRPPLNGRPSVPPPQVPTGPPPPAPATPAPATPAPAPPKYHVRPPSHAPPPPPGCLPQPPGHAPPPLPPKSQQSQPSRPPPAVPSNISNPPPPPPRHSSMRDTHADLDEKFKHMFQSQDSFPRPPVYRNVLKLYTNKQGSAC